MPLIVSEFDAGVGPLRLIALSQGVGLRRHRPARGCPDTCHWRSCAGEGSGEFRSRSCEGSAGR